MRSRPIDPLAEVIAALDELEAELARRLDDVMSLRSIVWEKRWEDEERAERDD